MVWERFVAMGDSTTEGLYDPDGQGGYRGWADRFAERLAADAAQDGREVRYANLAIRGRLSGQVRIEQLPAALAMEPDLASVLVGMNDLLRPSFDARTVAGDVEATLRALRAAGATVVTFTLPDATAINPWARPLRPRFRRLNAALRAAARRTGSILVDLEAEPDATDPTLWCEDRIHANPNGHERLAVGVARAVGLPVDAAAPGGPSGGRPGRRPRDSAAAAVARELSWGRRYLLPWVTRRARGEFSGDGLDPKLPTLLPVTPP